MALVSNYLKLTNKYKEEYGENTILLMQVGAFYEMYGLREPKSDEVNGSDILNFCRLCDLAISDKKICVGKKNVMMAGFRDYNIDKYINKMQQNNYTVVVYSQDEKAAGTTRSLTGIYSPGTYFSTNEEKLNNNTTCIWINKIRDQIVIGVSNIDIYTGKTNIFEYITQYSNSPVPYDELERFISIFDPSEIIFITNLKEMNLVINYVGIKCSCIHKINIEEDNTTMCKRAINCEKQTYQQEVLKQFFKNQTLFNYGDFLENNIATQSFCFLLDFVHEHNPNLTNKISVPKFQNCSDRLILANHSLKQLNMIPCDSNNGKLGSVSKFLNNCITCMGQRRFNTQIMNPIKNVYLLNKEYDIIKHILNNQNIHEVRSKLNLMKDIEKLNRKLVLKKITPCDFYHLDQNLNEINKLYKTLIKDAKILSYLSNDIQNNISELSSQIINEIKNIFTLNKINQINNLDFEDNFIREGYNDKHDKCVEEWMDSYDKLECIRKYLHDKISKFETNKKNNQLVKIHQTDKNGYSIIATKRRVSLLENQLNESPTYVTLTYYSKFKNKNCEFKFNLDDINFVQSTGSNYTIYSDEITTYCSNIVTSKVRMINSLNLIYKNFVEKIINLNEVINEIVLFVSIIDVIFSKSYTAKRYDHSCPTIDDKAENSFIRLKGLRHPLIEQLLQDEVYVKNDVSFDDDTLGILLYGTNAVGKSSFIKAIGISLIMAQSGMFVPCTKFNFKPYSYLFTRILGNDNIFKGLSTFEVEMLELKTILTLANDESLILGDELCSGTESDSAISIFIAGINKLYKQRSNFIFATHFHEIVNYDEVSEKKNLALKHMTVVYNKDIDSLIYDRQLRDGPGESMYGLEVCKSLHLPKDFLKEAHMLRNKYNPLKKSILEAKTSHFNKRKIMLMCEMCKQNLASEVHHLQHQKHANSSGNIDGFHKNHLGNLYSVCEDCHHKLHAQAEGHIKVNTSTGPILKNVC